MASCNHHHLEADLMLLGWIVLIITVFGILLIIRTNLYYQASIWEIDLEVGWSHSNLHLGFLDSGTVSLFALTSDLTNSETVAATL